MPSSLISLGANLGNTLETMRAAARLLRDSFPQAQLRFSSMIKTPPVGGPSGQGDFLNAIVRVDHSLSVWEVWDKIKRIENELGRQRFRRWESRRIDIDLILHGQELVWTPHLKVPHPRMSMRTFVIHPACEVAPELVDPVTQLTIRELSERLQVPQRPTISFGCNNSELLLEIQNQFSQSNSGETRDIKWFDCREPQDWSIGWPDADLQIACIAVPDPENVQWEDYCLPWAIAMGFAPSLSDQAKSGKLKPSLLGARYLLPGTQIEWVCHEIQAAMLALRCPIESTGNSWLG